MSNIPDEVSVWNHGHNSYALLNYDKILIVEEKRWMENRETRLMTFSHFMKITRAPLELIESTLEQMYGVGDWNDHI